MPARPSTSWTTCGGTDMTTDKKHSLFLLAVFSLAGAVLMMQEHFLSGCLSFFSGIAAAYGMRVEEP